MQLCKFCAVSACMNLEFKYSVHAGPGESWRLVLCYSQLLQDSSLALSVTSALDPVMLQA